MFGFGDGRLIGEVAQGAGHYLSHLDAAGLGQPANFWRDPYVLGFLFGTITVLARVAGGAKKMQGERGGRIALASLQPIAGAHAEAAKRDVVNLMARKDDVFLAAAGIAAQLVDYSRGQPISGLGLDIDGARENGKTIAMIMEQREDEEAIRRYSFSVLMEDHWLKVVADRFGVAVR